MKSYLRTCLLACALCLVCAACTIADQPGSSSIGSSDSAEVNFELVGPGGAALIIPVHINDAGPYSFVLDTGATFTCVGSEMQESLQLPDRSGALGFGAGVGGSGQVQMVRADSIRVGDVRAIDLTLCVIDLANLETTGLEVDGLLGLNFLKEFRVTLDFERNVATFR